MYTAEGDDDEISTREVCRIGLCLSERKPSQMKRLRIAVLLGAAASLLLSIIHPGVGRAASAATGWSVSSYSYPTNLEPGSDYAENGAHFDLLVTNVGAATSSGPTVVSDTLPAAVTLEGEPLAFYDSRPEAPTGEIPATCTIIGRTIECTLSGIEVQPGQLFHLELPVAISSAAAGTAENVATVSGSGASASTNQPVTFAAVPPRFGFLTGRAGLDGSITSASGASTTQAGAHPYQLTTSFALPVGTFGGVEAIQWERDGDARDVGANLPVGIVVNPEAVTVKCTEAQLESTPIACPPASQVGVANVTTSLRFGGPTMSNLIEALYAMVPPEGVPAEFGFFVHGANIIEHIRGKVRTGGDYGLSATASDILAISPILGTQVTLWGDPSDPSHDQQRANCAYEGLRSCPSVERSNIPLLTMPSACSGPLSTTATVDSWQEPGNTVSAATLSHDSVGNPTGVEGCGRLDFTPTVSAKPDASSSDSPAGFNFSVRLPQNEGQNNLATATLKKAVVSLPTGATLNPSAANGLSSCSPAQIGLDNAEVPTCPEASKLGTVEIQTPLLSDPLEGAVYLATPQQNPFNSLTAGYIVAEAHGALVKLAGRFELDQQTGQITASFDNNPQLPFEILNVKFFGGPRAPLRTPATCGTYKITTDLTPWSAPQAPDATPSDTFAISSGPGGSSCAATESQLPNKPSFEAGTVSPLAGTYSPFVLKLTRADGSQELSSIDTTLPQGLLGKLAGVTECSNAQIAVAQSRTKLGDGALEQSSPSCPLSAEVGTVNVGAGAGPSPYYVTGHAYLAGPYKGAPLSLEVITPAVAGPFDLGAVVVRTALYVNEITAQIHAVSDPFPRILDGIPLDIRSIGLNMNRPDFTLNPTSCDPMSVLGSATSILGQTAGLSNRFQVGGCGGLAFKPKLNIKLKGSTKRAGTPALRATLTYPKGNYANIASASVALPHSEFLDQAHIKTICTRVQFAEGATPGERCPPGSIYGHARAITPLLDQPLEGPVYLRSSSHPLPDLVAALNGQIQVVLDGTIDSVHGGIRNRFEMVPDAPVSKFTLTMQGGKKGLLENSTNLCRSTNKATVNLTAQNGKVYDTEPVVGNSCKKKHGKGKKKASRRFGSSHR